MRPRAEMSSWALRLRVMLTFLLSLCCRALPDQIRYSIPEELAKNSVVGDLAKDLGLRVQDLPARKLRVSAEKEYFTVNPDSGDLLVGDRIDREQICGRQLLCIVHFDVVAENPLNIFHVAVIVQDINDNTPLFKQNKIALKIGESTKPGKTFPLDPAQDSDAGLNSLQRYHLHDNEYFDLAEKQTSNGHKYPELILKHFLDREELNFHQLVLTAVDGGDPPRSSTTQIQIQVTDANDNPPVFSQDVYRVTLPEVVPPGFSVLQVTATDQDEGTNADITYSFHTVDEHVEQFFNLDKITGEITTKDNLDFEIANSYTLNIEAKDPGDLASHCSVQVEILDENDCAPEVIVTSVFTPLPEDSPPGTVIALIKTRDRDSGENADVYCQILENTGFMLKSFSKIYYKLVTDRALDREEISEYNVTITATDRGKVPLSSSTSIILHISDVNDNAPVFHQTSYMIRVAENNLPGVSIAQVTAWDSDLGPNGQVSYSIVGSDLHREWSVFVQRAVYREQLRALQLILQARDQGSPTLSANVSLRVLVGDRNDNALRVLYPALGPMAQRSSTRCRAPRSRATWSPRWWRWTLTWDTMLVLQARDPGLFSLGLRTGEVRTAPTLGDKDAVRHGGEPPLSATATLHLIVADNLQEFYLVVALALVSVLFLLAVILAIALRLRHSSSPTAWSCFQSGLSSKSGSRIHPNYTRTEFNFLNVTLEVAPLQDLLCGDPSVVACLNNGDPRLVDDASFSSHVFPILLEFCLLSFIAPPSSLLPNDFF
uniref:Protocadherin gamma subfamily B, 2 n=1 Tax=Chinchilla lanigera TaxID=34839 RepID=A0A8C2VP66_CHILA